MRKLKHQRTDFEQIGQYLAGAKRKLESATKILRVDEEAAYQLAYEAMLKGSLGFMLSHGVRPRSLPGHHVTIIEFAEKHLGAEFRDLISMFNRMRRKRHETIGVLRVLGGSFSADVLSGMRLLATPRLCPSYSSAFALSFRGSPAAWNACSAAFSSGLRGAPAPCGKEETLFSGEPSGLGSLPPMTIASRLSA